MSETEVKKNLNAKVDNIVVNTNKGFNIISKFN